MKFDFTKSQLQDFYNASIKGVERVKSETISQLPATTGAGGIKPPNFAGQVYDARKGWLNRVKDKISEPIDLVRNIYDFLTANPETIIQDLKLRKALTRKGGFGGKLIPELYKVYKIPRNARILANDRYIDVIANLKEPDEETFLKFIANLDLLKDKIQGKTVAGDLSLEQLEANLEFLEREKTPEISTSIRKYLEKNRAMRQDFSDNFGIELGIEDIGLTPEEIQYYLNKIQVWTGVGDIDIRDLYFPHAVQKYFEVSGYPGVPRRLTKQLFNSHLIGRAETGVPDDIVVNRDVILNTWTSMEIYSQYRKEMDKIIKMFDVMGMIDKTKDSEVWNFLKEYEKSGRILDLEDPNIPQKVKDTIKSIDPNYTQLQYFSLSNIQNIFPVENIDDKDVLSIIQEILPDILENPQQEVTPEQIQMLFGKYAKEIYALGRKPKILVPPEIAQAMMQWKPVIPKFARDIARLERKLFSHWTRVVLS